MRPRSVATVVLVALSFAGTAGCSAGSGNAGSLVSRQAVPADARAARVPASFAVVHRFFGGTSDGAHPVAGLTNGNGTLYGTTFEGGGGTGCAPGYCGTVFSLTATGQETILHRFGVERDGIHPATRLLFVGGTLYGTTSGGGSGDACGGGDGCGTVFKLDSAGNETVLYRFSYGDPVNGAEPSGLIDVAGSLYGTTAYGGTGCPNVDCGKVFKIDANARESVVHHFGGAGDGAFPCAGVINSSGSLYGTTEFGGANGLGTVFRIAPSGNEAVLYSFAGPPDGAQPCAGLLAVGNAMYGTTTSGGANGFGTVFKVTFSGQESVLYSFKGGADGANPMAGLIDVGGMLYGTTDGGGANGKGTVFQISTSGAESIVYDMTDTEQNARFGLANIGNTLYATTPYGGTNCPLKGCGTVFSLTL